MSSKNKQDETHAVYLGEDRPPLTEGEEGGVGEASLAAGDVDADGGVEESTLEPEGAASSESPLERSHRPVVRQPSSLAPQLLEPGLGLERQLLGKVGRQRSIRGGQDILSCLGELPSLP